MLTLVVMAAGLGSRFGALKQLEPVGNHGELIIDYSIYDAIQAGFKKVIFIIKEENKVQFEETIGHRFDPFIQVEYVIQYQEDIPGFKPHWRERKKPWGTGHAIYCVRDYIDDPFAVINADDFYGRNAFLSMAEFLKGNKVESMFSMIGYSIKNTLTEHGSVSRGVCQTDQNNLLIEVVEHPMIHLKNNHIVSDFNNDETELDENTVVSMNFWGLSKSFFSYIKTDIHNFSKNITEDKLNQIEYYLPTAIQNMMKQHHVKVKVLNTNAQWFGVTFKNDLAFVKESIKTLISQNEYPEELWWK